ncbi:hypothetical protein DFH07DRAFT_775960 [Mycena maculata]|uniref:Uncharacterized protein n=1 Tax=Mycena maculata TaxID=230809 RepID=A0AAD7IPD0_9AGAR|nr:hypothetical protein DFH07DRAFT_775960 [Mycena maculata]
MVDHMRCAWHLPFSTGGWAWACTHLVEHIECLRLPIFSGSTRCTTPTCLRAGSGASQQRISTCKRRQKTKERADGRDGRRTWVKEFVWQRDGTAFELITWLKDRTLRFWPVDAETMAKVREDRKRRRSPPQPPPLEKLNPGILNGNALGLAFPHI